MTVPAEDVEPWPSVGQTINFMNGSIEEVATVVKALADVTGYANDAAYAAASDAILEGIADDFEAFAAAGSAGVITFSTAEKPLGAFVDFGESADDLSTQTDAFTTDFTQDANSGGATTQWMHSADLMGLERGHTYFYRACTGNSEPDCSETYSFTTIPDEPAHETNLMMFGDLGHDGGDLAHKLLTALPAMVDEAAAGNIDM